MKDEILAGLRNALERGESMDTAIKSFIQAGYNPVEVKSAAEEVSSGVSSFIDTSQSMQTEDSTNSQGFFSSMFHKDKNPEFSATELTNTKPASKLPTPQQFSKLPTPTQIPEIRNLQYLKAQDNQKKKKKLTLVWLLVIFLIVLFSAIALLMLFGESLLNLFFG